MEFYVTYLLKLSTRYEGAEIFQTDEIYHRLPEKH
jgi:hypothetical protein